MGKIGLRTFAIVLATSPAAYRAGDAVVGKCVIGLEGELRLDAIRMQLMAVADVEWSESRGSGGHRRNRTFHDSIQYLRLEYDFVGNTFDAVIGKGIHEFPFAYQLPQQGTPSSFDSPNGSVKYWIEAEILKPLFSFNHRTRADFLVECPLDCQHLTSPVGQSGQRRTAWLPWQKAGSVQLDVSVDRPAFEPGESISVVCLVTNRSSVRVSPRAVMRQTVTFSAKDKQKTKRCKFVAQNALPVDSGLTNQETLQVPIPANADLSGDCPLIVVSYDVHVTVEVPSGLNVHVDVPVVVSRLPRPPQ